MGTTTLVIVGVLVFFGLSTVGAFRWLIYRHEAPRTKRNGGPDPSPLDV
jgi:hypothetical protein